MIYYLKSEQDDHIYTYNDKKTGIYSIKKYHNMAYV